MLGQIVFWALTAAAPLEGTDFDDALAANLDIDPSTFTRLVEALSTRIGSVRADDALNDNPVRTRPIICLSSGEWMWPRPIDFVHAALDWGYAVVQRNTRLAAAYDKARHHTTEDLTEETLRAVFGDRVHRSVRYPTDEADAEIDVLVALPGAVLVVECKGGRFSRAGRRGAPRRVDRHVQDIVDRANHQNARTERAILDGLTFTDTDGHPIDIDPTATVLTMTVTLDRVDPFSAYLGFAEDGDSSQRSWIINLADLLLLAEVLPAPSEFIAYLVERRTMLTNEVTVFVEADSLGASCRRPPHLDPHPHRFPRQCRSEDGQQHLGLDERLLHYRDHHRATGRRGGGSLPQAPSESCRETPHPSPTASCDRPRRHARTRRPELARRRAPRPSLSRRGRGTS